jgi:SAM-dependent methyltransferase
MRPGRLADDRFDVVLSFAMLHHVGDWRGAVAEAVRVLRPGGHFVGWCALDGAASAAAARR